LVAFDKLPNLIGGRQKIDYTITELSEMMNEASTDVDRRRGFILGDDLIDLLDPLPKMPYILALVILNLITVLLSVTSWISLKSRAIVMNEKKDERLLWISILLIGKGLGRLSRFVSSGFLCIAPIIGLCSILLWPPLYLIGARVDLSFANLDKMANELYQRFEIMNNVVGDKLYVNDSNIIVYLNSWFVYIWLCLLSLCLLFTVQSFIARGTIEKFELQTLKQERGSSP
jgi:hypothetical protein